MPTFKSQKLREIGYELFQKAGCLQKDSQSVVDHLVESNLFGHDSHGAIRFAEYLRALREERFQPQATPEVIQDYPCLAVVDANGGLGQIGANFAMDLAVEKANKNGIGTVALRNTSHIGRIGAYPLLAAKQGFIAQAFVNAGRLGYQIAPFGGIEGVLSTNPMAFSAPRREENPIVLDMTTSVVAEGKIRVAINKESKVPEGWIIDSQGNPTTDPLKFKADPPGAILPLGGVVGHKGTGLSIMVELLGGALSGQGCAAGERKMTSNGVLFTVYNIEHFTELDRYFDLVESLISHVKSSRPGKGFKEILIPGEPEFRSALRREEEGIDIDGNTWADIRKEAKFLKVNLSDS